MIRSSTARLALLTTAFLLGCSAEDKSAMRDLAADKAATNVALFFGSPTNLAGVHQDIRKNKELFEDQSYGWGFNVTAVNLATKRMILDTTREKAAQVSANGTLLWYFSGHGLESGAMYTEDQQTLQFKEIAELIKSVRDVPLKRLVVVIDNCFAGTNLQGSNSIIPQGAAGLTGERAMTDAEAVQAQLDDIVGALSGGSTYASGTLYQQALVITASQASETSLDGATGGVFSEAWRGTLKEMKGNKTATLGQMAEKTKSSTRQSSGGHHTPVYRAIPSEQILAEPLFGSGPNGGGDGGLTTPVPSTELFAAMNDAGALYVAAPAAIQSVTICRGSMAACWAKPTAEASFGVSDKQITGLAVFKAGAFTPAGSQDYTVLAYGTGGKLVAARMIRFSAR